jgi:hypothetical protein
MVLIQELGYCIRTMKVFEVEIHAWMIACAPLHDVEQVSGTSMFVVKEVSHRAQEYGRCKYVVDGSGGCEQGRF